jgi:hypothetical protein
MSVFLEKAKAIIASKNAATIELFVEQLNALLADDAKLKMAAKQLKTDVTTLLKAVTLAQTMLLEAYIEL